jgi:hypothetical protein
VDEEVVVVEAGGVGGACPGGVEACRGGVGVERRGLGGSLEKKLAAADGGLEGGGLEGDGDPEKKDASCLCFFLGGESGVESCDESCDSGGGGASKWSATSDSSDEPLGARARRAAAESPEMARSDETSAAVGPMAKKVARGR